MSQQLSYAIGPSGTLTLAAASASPPQFAPSSLTLRAAEVCKMHADYNAQEQTRLRCEIIAAINRGMITVGATECSAVTIQSAGNNIAVVTVPRNTTSLCNIVTITLPDNRRMNIDMLIPKPYHGINVIFYIHGCIEQTLIDTIVAHYVAHDYETESDKLKHYYGANVVVINVAIYAKVAAPIALPVAEQIGDEIPEVVAAEEIGDLLRSIVRDSKREPTVASAAAADDDDDVSSIFDLAAADDDIAAAAPEPMSAIDEAVFDAVNDLDVMSQASDTLSTLSAASSMDNLDALVSEPVAEVAAGIDAIVAAAPAPPKWRLIPELAALRIEWERLSSNPHPAAVELLRANPDKIDWDALSSNTNPDAIALFRTADNFANITWHILSRNRSDAAVDLLLENPSRMHRGLLLGNSNPRAVTMLQSSSEKYTDIWMLRTNESDWAAKLLLAAVDFSTPSWGGLSANSNPLVVAALKLLPARIAYDYLAQNTHDDAVAMLLQHYRTANARIEWRWLAQNTNPAAFAFVRNNWTAYRRDMTPFIFSNPLIFEAVCE